MKYRINIGCGKTPTENWLNFDNSYSIILANSPLKYWIAKNLKILNKDQIEYINWIKKNNIYYADVAKKIPLPNESAECIYTSHMLEHLSRKEANFFLNESLRVLEKGGILRVAVPDLKIAVSIYNETQDADAFMETILVAPPSLETIKQKISLFFSGYRHHQWMYDEKSLSKLLKKIGFKEVFTCKAGQTNIENPGSLNLLERVEESVYLEAKK